MRTISKQLLLAQKRLNTAPCLKVEVADYGHPAGTSGSGFGMKQVQFDELWGDSEEVDLDHAMCFASDGSLNRIKIEVSGPSYAFELFHQRVENPTPESDYTVWASLGTWDDDNSVGVCTMCADPASAEVMIITPAGYLRSPNYGKDWSSSFTWINWAQDKGLNLPRVMSACYKGNTHDLGVVYVTMVAGDQMYLRVFRRISGVWTDSASSLETYPGLYVRGMAMFFDTNWNIILQYFVGGTAFSARQLIFYDVTGLFSAVVESALTDAKAITQESLHLTPFHFSDSRQDYAFRSRAELVTTGTTDNRMGDYLSVRWVAFTEINEVGLGINVLRTSEPQTILAVFHNEKTYFYTMKEGTTWLDGIWFRAYSYENTADKGMSLATDGTYIYAEKTNQILRSSYYLNWQEPAAGSGAGDSFVIDQSRLLKVKEIGLVHNESLLELTFDNSDGYFNNLTDEKVQIRNGAMVSIFYGYKINNENQYHEAGRYFIESPGYGRMANKSVFILKCVDGWGLLRRAFFSLVAMCNDNVETDKTYELIDKVLSIIGATLEFKSGVTPDAIYPRLQINAGDSAAETVKLLISYIPQVFYFFGLTLYGREASTSDDADYEYDFEATTDQHPIISGNYETPALPANTIFMVGQDDDTNPIKSLTSNTTEAAGVGERNLIGNRTDFWNKADMDTLTATMLTKLRFEVSCGKIVIKPNLAQELWDVVSITDSATPIKKEKFRVIGYQIDYDVSVKNGVWEEILLLGYV